MPGDALRKALDELGSLADAVAATPQPQAGDLAEVPRTRSRGRPASPNPLGRPTLYSEALARLICTRIARGETLEQIMDADGMPDRTIVFDWLAKQPTFANSYARARAMQAEAILERGFGEAWRDLEPRHVNRARLRWDSSRWLAGKLDPRWGDRTTVDMCVTDPAAAERAATQRAQLIAALQRLARAAPLTIEGGKPSEPSD
jgi:hypothetical protein